MKQLTYRGAPLKAPKIANTIGKAVKKTVKKTVDKIKKKHTDFANRKNNKGYYHY